MPMIKPRFEARRNETIGWIIYDTYHDEVVAATTDHAKSAVVTALNDYWEDWAWKD